MKTQPLLEYNPLQPLIKEFISIQQGNIYYIFKMNSKEDLLSLRISEENTYNEEYVKDLTISDINKLQKFSKSETFKEFAEYIKAQVEKNLFELIITKNKISFKLKQENIELQLDKTKLNREAMVMNLCEDMIEQKNKSRSIDNKCIQLINSKTNSDKKIETLENIINELKKENKSLQDKILKTNEENLKILKKLNDLELTIKKYENIDEINKSIIKEENKSIIQEIKQENTNNANIILKEKESRYQKIEKSNKYNNIKSIKVNECCKKMNPEIIKNQENLMKNQSNQNINKIYNKSKVSKKQNPNFNNQSINGINNYNFLDVKKDFINNKQAKINLNESRIIDDKNKNNEMKIINDKKIVNKQFSKAQSKPNLNKRRINNNSIKSTPKNNELSKIQENEDPKYKTSSNNFYDSIQKNKFLNKYNKISSKNGIQNKSQKKEIIQKNYNSAEKGKNKKKTKVDLRNKTIEKNDSFIKNELLSSDSNSRNNNCLKNILSSEKDNNIKNQNEIKNSDLDNNDNSVLINKNKNPDNIGRKSLKYLKPKKAFKNCPNGLKKIGEVNTMNAILQCLANIKEFINYFLVNKEEIERKKSKQELVYSFLEIINHLWNKKSIEEYDPSNFIEIVNKMNPIFTNDNSKYETKDLLIFILETLHKELNEEIIENQDFEDCYDKDFNIYLKNFEEHFQKNFKSIISDLFYIKYDSQIKCLNCNNNLHKIKLCNLLEFNLEEVKEFNNKFKKNYITITDCFTNYYEKKNYAINKCGKCNQKKNASNNIILVGPKILIIYLNRNPNNDIKIKLEEKINLNNFIENKGRQYNYELINVMSNLGNGHYLAFCNSFVDNKWYKYDNSFVNISSFREANSQAIPYLLFYLLDK